MGFFPKDSGAGDAGHSHKSDAEIKSQWECTFIPSLLPSWHGHYLGFVDTLKAYCIRQDAVMFYRENLDLIKI